MPKSCFVLMSQFMAERVVPVYLSHRDFKLATFHENSFFIAPFMHNGAKKFVKLHLEPSCCKKWQKSPNQETGLRNRRHLKVLNDIKFVLMGCLNHVDIKRCSLT